MRVTKLGDGLAVGIPDDVAKSLGLKEGDEVDIRLSTPDQLGIGVEMTREEALDGLRKYRGRMPADFKFDREEANAR